MRADRAYGHGGHGVVAESSPHVICVRDAMTIRGNIRGRGQRNACGNLFHEAGQPDQVGRIVHFLQVFSEGLNDNVEVDPYRSHESEYQFGCR